MARYIDADKQTDRAFQLNFDKKISERELAIVNRLIAESPTEDVAPIKHGKWIESNDIIIRGTCSCCGWNAIDMETDVFGMPFCPNCGAEMEEEDGKIY